MSSRSKGRTGLSTTGEGLIYENAGLDLGFLDDPLTTGEGPAGGMDGRLSPASSSTKKRMFPGDYQRRLPELVIVDFGDFLQTCLKRDICKFNDFFSLWREYDFGLLYSCGLPALHTGHLIDTFHAHIQELFLHERDIHVRILLLFAMYSLYASQPFQRDTIRKPIAIHWDTFSSIKTFYRDSLLIGENAAYDDAAQIFYYRLLKGDAFQLHLAPLTMTSASTATALLAKDMIDVNSLGGAAVRVQSLAQTPILDDTIEIRRREALYEELLTRCRPNWVAQHRPNFANQLCLHDVPVQSKQHKSKKPRSRSLERQGTVLTPAFSLPQRPSTAPPHGRSRSVSGGDLLYPDRTCSRARSESDSRSVSPLDRLALDVDMPDLSSFLQ